jgi:hypothetical protein
MSASQHVDIVCSNQAYPVTGADGNHYNDTICRASILPVHKNDDGNNPNNGDYDDGNSNNLPPWAQ